MRNIINLNSRDALNQLAWIERLRDLLDRGVSGQQSNQSQKKSTGKLQQQQQQGKENSRDVLNTKCPICHVSFYDSALMEFSCDWDALSETAESRSHGNATHSSGNKGGSKAGVTSNKVLYTPSCFR